MIRLFVLILTAEKLQVLGFENPAAIAAANIIHTIPAGNQFGTIVVAEHTHSEKYHYILDAFVDLSTPGLFHGYNRGSDRLAPLPASLDPAPFHLAV
ncbi:hypothetical protein [Paludibaculum fermentans]|uniref:hypothetical protein n=1 Tax=Paludibaculum fermentans TaxID=1473598 RepID=UPI003EB6BDA0